MRALRPAFAAAAVVASTLLAPSALAAEGKWTPEQVHALGPAWLKAQGFELPLSTLWDPAKGGGLLANAIQVPGCSASFVSADGLLVTNHHCAVGILQEHSTTERNLLRDGFLAATRADEKKARAYRAQVPRAFTDVTAEVRAAVPAGAADAARARAVERKGKALVAACEQRKGAHCEFHVHDGGVAFALTEFDEYGDVRLVWAPPVGVGNFGGEIDNWSWPRHTGDFALLRVYGPDGQPYRPRWSFPLSPRGVRPGDAVAVLGYPGTTFRAYVADEMAERAGRFYPAALSLAREWEAIIEEEGARSDAVKLALAADLRGLTNRRKNAEGQLAGFRRGRIVERRREDEARVLAWARAHGRADAVAARDGLAALAAEKVATFDRDFLLDQLGSVARTLRWPVQAARRAAEAARPDAEREPGWQERDLSRVREELQKDQGRYAPAADRRLALSWVRRALALPEGQRLAPVEARFRGKDDAAILAALDAWAAASPLMKAEGRLAAFDETRDALAARNDPLTTFGLELDAERRALRDRREAWTGAALRLRPAWRAAEAGEAGRPLAPDANRSLRASFGRVKGYAPRDAVTFAPQTTLAGVLEKATGEEPFDAPAWLLEARRAGKLGRFADPVLKDVPVDFLADLDTTGGNSGSPVIDARGRLVGVNFDRVWENVANDFGYVPAVARNVTADARYLLWILEQEGAQGQPGAAALLEELLAH
ncbi:MAG: S46 family peptidase [Anaeromyxobacter sp.]